MELRESSDKRLIGRLRQGDHDAVAELAAEYGAKVYQLAFRYLKNREDAEEVTQDVLLKVFRRIDAFRGDAALSSWIYRITFNSAMSRLRAARPMLRATAGEYEYASEEGGVRQTLRVDAVDGRPSSCATSRASRPRRPAGCCASRTRRSSRACTAAA